MPLGAAQRGAYVGLGTWAGVRLACTPNLTGVVTVCYLSFVTARRGGHLPGDAALRYVPTAFGVEARETADRAGATALGSVLVYY